MSLMLYNPVTKKWDVHWGGTTNAAHVFSSVKLWEDVNIGGGDHTVTINGGVGMGIYCDTAGEILKIDTTIQSAYTTPALQAGFNPMEVTKVYQTGSTIVGNVAVLAW